METLDQRPPETWLELPLLAACLNCSTRFLRRQGERRKFRLKREGPRKTVACADEAVAFYTAQFPDVEINRDAINALVKPAQR